MNNTHNIHDAIETLEHEVSELLNQKKDLELKINDVNFKLVGIKSTLSYLKDKSQPEKSTSVDAAEPKKLEAKHAFRPNLFENLTNPLSIKDRIKNFVEKEITSFVSSEFIADKVREKYYPTHDAETFKGTVSTYLSRLSKGKYAEADVVSFRYSGSKRDTVWGRKSWLNEVGQPQKQYFDNIGVDGANAA